MTLTDTQYQVLLNLYHELNDAFKSLPHAYQLAFYGRLYSKT